MPHSVPVRAHMAPITIGLMVLLVLAGQSWPVLAQTTSPSNIRVLHLPTNDLVADPASASGLLFVSIPSSAGSLGNSITSIDPSTGTVTSPVWVGSEPDRL